MKNKAFYLLIMILLLPATVFAKESPNNPVLESQIIKYYKIFTKMNDLWRFH